MGRLGAGTGISPQAKLWFGCGSALLTGSRLPRIIHEIAVKFSKRADMMLVSSLVRVLPIERCKVIVAAAS